MIKLIHTCDACPAQWEGQDELGHWYYFRYRWDTLTVTKSKSPANYMDDNFFEEGEEVISVGGYTGNGYSGSMSEDELKILTSEIIDWSGELQRSRTAPE